MTTEKCGIFSTTITQAVLDPLRGTEHIDGIASAPETLKLWSTIAMCPTSGRQYYKKDLVRDDYRKQSGRYSALEAQQGEELNQPGWRESGIGEIFLKRWV